jgi:hypothetical protein
VLLLWLQQGLNHLIRLVSAVLLGLQVSGCCILVQLCGVGTVTRAQ